MLIEALALEHSRLISLCGAGGKTTLMFSLAREFIAAGEQVLVTTTTKIAREEAEGWPSLEVGTVGHLLDRVGALLRPAKRPGAVIAYSGIGGDGYRLVGYAPEFVDELANTRRFDRILVEADGSARKPLKAPAEHEPVIAGETDALIMVAGMNGMGLPLDEANLFRAEIWSKLSGLALGSPVNPESLARCVSHPDGLARGCPADARRLLFLNQADTPARQASAKRVADDLATSAAKPVQRVVIGQLLPHPQITEVVSF